MQQLKAPKLEIMYRTVILTVLSFVASAANAVMTAGPFHPVSPPLQSACCASAVSSVSDARGYVVFWIEASTLYAHRVGSSGMPEGVPIALGAATGSPVVASAGDSILVLSSNTTGLVAGTMAPIEVRVLTSDLQSAEIRGSLPVGTALGVAFDGADYLVAMSRLGNSTWELWMARISLDGHLLASRELEVEPVANPVDSVALATNGSGALLIWTDSVRGVCGSVPCQLPTRLRAATVNRALELTALRGEILAQDVLGRRDFRPSAVWTGSTFVATWTDAQRIITATWDSHSSSLVQRTWDERADLITGHSAVWDGRSVVIVTGAPRQLYAGRLDRWGAPIDEGQPVIVVPGATHSAGVRLAAGSEGNSLMTTLSSSYVVHVSIIEAGPPRRRAAGRR